MFRKATDEDVLTLASWIRSAHDCALWAGSAFPFPFEVAGLVEKLNLPSTTSICLVEETVVAFGQLADKGDGRAHLARIVVAPMARRQGYGEQLVRELLRIAANWGFRIVGLNVNVDNQAAIRMYTGLGFVFADRPSHVTASPDAHYMAYDLVRQTSP